MPFISRRKSFMTRLFSGKSNAMNVPSPRASTAAAAAAAASSTAVNKKTAPLDLSSINLGISSNNFDSMSTKSATSSKPDETTNDMSRLIDVTDIDNDDDEERDDDSDNDRINNMLNESADYDFLNNW